MFLILPALAASESGLPLRRRLAQPRRAHILARHEAPHRLPVLQAAASQRARASTAARPRLHRSAGGGLPLLRQARRLRTQRLPLALRVGAGGAACSSSTAARVRSSASTVARVRSSATISAPSTTCRRSWEHKEHAPRCSSAGHRLFCFAYFAYYAY
jgi:hypothetical protein